MFLYHRFLVHSHLQVAEQMAQLDEEIEQVREEHRVRQFNTSAGMFMHVVQNGHVQ